MDDIEIRIPNLSTLDVEGIRSHTPEGSIEVERPISDPKKMNELMTLAVIGGIGLLSSAASYFFGKHRSDVIELDFEVLRKDGSALRVRVRVSKSSNEPVDTQIMSQIRAAMAA